MIGPRPEVIKLGQHRIIPALRLKHRSGGCGTASALPKCSIMSGCGSRIVLRGQKPLALCDRCPCFGSLFPPLAALTFAASSIICAFGLASAAPRSSYRHLELCGIALYYEKQTPWPCFLRQPGRFCNHLQNKPRPGAKNARFYLWFQQKNCIIKLINALCRCISCTVRCGSFAQILLWGRGSRAILAAGQPQYFDS